MQFINIGEAAAAAGVTPKMIRHYETLGLIPQPGRTESGYRRYGVREIAMLRFIRQSRGLGFSMQQIEGLMSLWRDPSRHSSDVKRLALEQLAALEERQQELDQMRGTLEDLVSRCRGDHTAHCAILETLAQPAAAPLPVAGRERARKALTEVRPGERRERSSQRAEHDAGAMVPAHAGLSAWARAIAHAG